ncbi:hypothetical protein GN330_11860 [Nitratireductor sp. CAU 1489]|uniref:Uncharacterized protein n=1 Tax=Nitratireductor arenosus TaxID=2682096 RepID=A0A844QJ41_9HYPH|nr:MULTISPECIES: hypothetical protein [Nitratireductor]MVA97941.1 hypothetical protein [Nitratireductor arenosus]PSM19967.1 hypothetical protein C7T96_02575 [Nitratireductor sp. StC3]
MSSSRSDARREEVTRLVEEGGYVAKIRVTLIYETDDPTNWGPYLSADDALKLDAVRSALRRGDIAGAARHGEIFELLPVSA